MGNRDISGQFKGESRILFQTENGQVIVGMGTSIYPPLFPNPVGHRRSLYSANNEVAAGINNVAAEFEASGATASSSNPGATGGENLAIKAVIGKSLLGNAKVNGMPTLVTSLPPGDIANIDSPMYEFVVCNYPTGSLARIDFKPPLGRKYLLLAGTEIVIFSNNDASSIYIVNEVRGNNNLRIKIYRLRLDCEMLPQ